MANDAPPPAPASPKTSGLAIASLVLGILGCTSIIGLVLGIIALVRINDSRGTLGGRGVAIAGICVSSIMLLLVPIVATLAGLMLPALAKAKERAQTINCLSNVKQLGAAARTYATGSGGRLPQGTNWCDVLRPHVGAQKVFHCPSEKSLLCGYGFNAALSGLSVNDVDPATVMFFEIPGGWNVSGGPEQILPRARHGQIITVVFADGSAQQVQQFAAPNLRWEP